MHIYRMLKGTEMTYVISKDKVELRLTPDEMTKLVKEVEALTSRGNAHLALSYGLNKENK